MLHAVICPACGTENLAGAKFCMECASPLAATCPNCGFANLPGAKFCSECATPLAAGARPATAPPPTAQPAAAQPGPADSGAERRLVSILFADLVGFTPFAEERDAEDVRETLTRYFDLAREVIERYGGTVEKFIGDAVMAVWGAPVAQEDDAERAVRAALELVDVVKTLGGSIQARAGVLTGEAAVTIGATNQGMVAGDLVNTASRLQSVAEPGTVLVGESTQRATSESIVFEQLANQALKGKTSPVPAWRALRVVAQRRGRGRSEALEAPFVGRDDEMRLLKDLFHATNRERRPRLVSVIGPAGIGKSRLAWEFLKYIDGLSDTVYWHDGRSPAYGEGISFWALGEMVRQRAGLAEADDEATTREKVAASVREHVPDEQERVTVERALLALLGFGSVTDPQELFGAWRTYFERLAGEYPVVMVFEDLHFADAGLLDFVDHMLDWTRSSPITIVTLARPELLERRPNWGAGKRSFSSIYLEPLSAVDMRELLSGLVPGLPAKAMATIVARAEGIPLYAVETVRMLLADGRLELADGVYRPTSDLGDIAVPQTLTALIAARLDGLDAADRALIADAAVLGVSFSTGALAALADTDPGEIERRLDGLERRELLHHEIDPQSPERGQYVFVQALIREVAYNTLAKKDRKSRHLAAARHFESLGTDEVAGALASHYLAAYQLAADGPESEALATQARLALRGAAERAASLGSHQQALGFLEQALQTTSDPAEMADLHQRGFDSAKEGLDPELTVSHARAVADAQRQLGDRAGLAAAQAQLGHALTNFLIQPDRALEVLLPAWEEFSDLEQTAAGVSLMIAIAFSYSRLDREDDMLPWMDRALPVAERLDLLPEIAAALLGRGSAMVRIGRPREAMILLRGSHALAQSAGIRDRERGGRILITFFEQWGEPANGLRLTREGLEIARQQGSAAYASAVVGNGAVCALRLGEWEWARALVEEWVPEGEDTPVADTEFLIDRAILDAVRGADATADIERAAAASGDIPDPQFQSYVDWARAWAEFGAGHFADARRHALRAARATSFFMPMAAPLAARAALWDRELDAARNTLAELNVTMFRGDALALDKATLEAGIAALEGRAGDALAKYREAVRGWRTLQCAWEEALAVVDMVTFLGGDDAEMKEEADWARSTLTRLGAQPYLERLEAALAAPPVRAAVRASARKAEAETPAAG
jgi:class 3 adenylate cyclase